VEVSVLLRIWSSILLVMLVSGLEGLAQTESEREDSKILIEEPVASFEEPKEGTDWVGVLKQSLICQGIFHAFRMTEEKTRRELGGPFFKDWGDSIKAIQWKWDDDGKFFTNYISHPWSGSIYANIFAFNNDHSRRVTFGWNKDYWNAKHKQFLFSTVSSFAFEIGPISEASLGNVGINRPGAQTVVDYVMTPVVGTYVWSVGEDALDRVAMKVEKNHKYWGRLLRSLCITKSFVNVFLEFKLPWFRHRDHVAPEMDPVIRVQDGAQGDDPASSGNGGG
jgi:hypothetical protein